MSVKGTLESLLSEASHMIFMSSQFRELHLCT